MLATEVDDYGGPAGGGTDVEVGGAVAQDSDTRAAAAEVPYHSPQTYCPCREKKSHISALRSLSSPKLRRSDEPVMMAMMRSSGSHARVILLVTLLLLE